MNNPLLLSSALDSLSTSATLHSAQSIVALRSQGLRIAHFGFGQSPFSVPQLLVDALIDNAHENSYFPVSGLPALRQAVADYYQCYYNYLFTKDSVQITPGSKSAIFNLLFCLQGPLLLPSPSWVSYAPQAQLLGKDVVTLPTIFSDRYLLQPSTLRSVCERLGKSGQKILLLNSPNNPTGQQYPQSLLNALAAVCQEYGVIVISDEIYAGVCFPGQEHSSIYYAYPEKTIVTSGLSKSLSGGGYRLGFCMVPASLSELMPALEALMSETISCVTAPVQYAALAAYTQWEQLKTEMSQINAIHALANHYVANRLIEAGVGCHPGEGGFYLMPTFSGIESLLMQGVTTDTALCQWLLARSVTALPGSAFGIASKTMTLRLACVDFCGEDALRAYQGGAKLNDDFVRQWMPNLEFGCDQVVSGLS